MKCNGPLKIVLLLALLFFCRAGIACGNAASPVTEHTRQLMVVVTPDWNAVPGTLYRYERKAGRWKPVGKPVPVVVGRNGLAWGDGLHPSQADGPSKREGDGKSPAGIFSLGSVFGLAPAGELSGLRLPYFQLVSGLECVDDAKSSRYNSILMRGSVPDPDWNSSEKMWEIEVEYRLGLVVNHNARRRAGGGSCIFMHVWNGPQSSTSGCTAMAYEEMKTIALWLDPAAAPLLVQLPASEYQARRKPWALPTLPRRSNLSESKTP